MEVWPAGCSWSQCLVLFVSCCLALPPSVLWLLRLSWFMSITINGRTFPSWWLLRGSGADGFWSCQSGEQPLAPAASSMSAVWPFISLYILELKERFVQALAAHSVRCLSPPRPPSPALVCYQLSQQHQTVSNKVNAVVKFRGNASQWLHLELGGDFEIIVGLWSWEKNCNYTGYILNVEGPDCQIVICKCSCRKSI